MTSPTRLRFARKSAPQPDTQGQNRPRARARRRPGAMAHRLFSGFCALWFGALFALGSMAASAEALGALVVHLHLPAILPAAAPPLGMTARVLLTVILGLLGTGFGLVIGLVLHRRAGGAVVARPRAARRARDESQDSMADDIAPAAPSNPAPSQIAAMQAGAPRVRSRDAHPDAPPRRPLVVTEDVLPYAATSAFSTPDQVAPESFVRPAATTPLDQALTDLGGNDLGGDLDLDAAPLAGDELPPFLAAAYRATQQAVPAAIGGDAVEPAIGGDAVEPAMGHPADAPVALVPALAAPVVAAAPAAAAMPHPAPEPEPEPAPVAVEAAAPVRRDPVLPRVPLASLAVAAPQVPIGEAPLDSLGLVQLIERLAQAIAVRQAHRAHDRDRLDGTSAVAPAMAVVAQPAATHPAGAIIDPLMPLHRFDPLTMDPAGPLLRAKPQRVTAHAADGAQATITALDAARRNAAPDGAGNDEYECAEDAGDHGAVPENLPENLGENPGENSGGEDDISLVEHRYSSLAAMAMPRPELVPAALVGMPATPEIPAADHAVPAAAGPVVPFRLTATRPQSGARVAMDLAPDAAADDAADPDRALREALATLRRMSGQR